MVIIWKHLFVSRAGSYPRFPMTIKCLEKYNLNCFSANLDGKPVKLIIKDSFPAKNEYRILLSKYGSHRSYWIEIILLIGVLQWYSFVTKIDNKTLI